MTCEDYVSFLTTVCQSLPILNQVEQMAENEMFIVDQSMGMVCSFYCDVKQAFQQTTWLIT